MRAMAKLSFLWCLLVLVVNPASARTGSSGQAECSTDSCVTASDDNAMLQKHVARARSKPVHAGDARAMAVAGGGWRAYSVASATTAAVLHELSRQHEGATLKELFSNIDMVSSNSGGSWFSSSLIFTGDFGELVYAMAANPLRAGVIFNETWTKKLLGKGDFGPPFDGSETVDACLQLYAEEVGIVSAAAQAVIHSGVDVVEALIDACVAKSKVKKGAHAKCQTMVHMALSHKKITLEALRSKVEEAAKDTDIPFWQDMWQAVYIFGYTGGMSWTDIVQASLEKTVNLQATTTLGSEPQAWAHGKTWIICTSVATPLMNGSTSVHYSEDLLNSSSAFYRAAALPEEAMRKYIPAHFSIVLGEGEDAQAPYPFCASQNCFGFIASVQGVDGESAHAVEALTSPRWGREAFQDAGRLSVINAISSSSAALASSVLTNYTAWATSSGCVDFATWISNASDGQAWAEGENTVNKVREQVDKATIDMLAEKQVYALFDGAYTDNTGVAWAVASGASEVLLIQNGGASDIWGLCTGSPPEWGGTLGGLSFAIFEQTADDIQALYNAMPTLHIPAVSNNTWLKAIVWGSFYLTTADNKWFGIKAGQQVRLNVISVESVGVSMAGLSNFWAYGTLVNDITSTFADAANAHAVKTILQEFYAPLSA